ncbi:hypothetical protein B0H14DRAFT_3156755 [Mycena olivaceomarginata]|nr:hypothetical protein B0H14DRAFT_3156755 [Mycena olivaceomarginata]
MRRPTVEPTLSCAAQHMQCVLELESEHRGTSLKFECSSPPAPPRHPHWPRACPTCTCGHLRALSLPSHAPHSYLSPVRPVLLAGTVATAPGPEVLAVLPNVHLVSFGKDETICTVFVIPRRNPPQIPRFVFSEPADELTSKLLNSLHAAHMNGLRAIRHASVSQC